MPSLDQQRLHIVHADVTTLFLKLPGSKDHVHSIMLRPARNPHWPSGRILLSLTCVVGQFKMTLASILPGIYSNEILGGHHRWAYSSFVEFLWNRLFAPYIAIGHYQIFDNLWSAELKQLRWKAILPRSLACSHLVYCMLDFKGTHTHAH